MTLTIAAATHTAVAAYKDAGVSPSAHYPYGYCLGFTEPGYPFPVPPTISGAALHGAFTR